MKDSAKSVFPSEIQSNKMETPKSQNEIDFEKKKRHEVE